MARKAAEALSRGVPAARALREAGFPKSSCQHGLRGINRMVRAELKTLGRKYIQMGRDLTPEDQELLVRGMLFENVILKTDKGVQAAKQLGADKRISMWQPDSQVGMVVLSPPPIPKLDHEVPWMDSRFQRKRRAFLEANREERSAQQSHEEQEREPEEMTAPSYPEPDEVRSEEEVSSAQREWEEEGRKAKKYAKRKAELSYAAVFWKQN